MSEVFDIFLRHPLEVFGVVLDMDFLAHPLEELYIFNSDYLTP